MEEIIKREIAKEVDGFRVSVVQFQDETYEIAVLFRDRRGNWDIDYSIFPEVLQAETSMEVYGTIQYIIAPAYYEEFGVNLAF